MLFFFFTTLAAIHNWHLIDLDVSNTFLFEDLEETVYMKLPSG